MACWREVQTKYCSVPQIAPLLFFPDVHLLRLNYSNSNQQGCFKGLVWMWYSESFPSALVLSSQVSLPRQSRSSSPQTAPEKTTRGLLQGTTGSMAAPPGICGCRSWHTTAWSLPHERSSPEMPEPVRTPELPASVTVKPAPQWWRQLTPQQLIREEEWRQR